MNFYNYKNNKRTNSKFNKVFATRRHFDVKFGTVFFFFFFSNELGNIRQNRTIFFSTKSVSDQKIRDFRVSDRGASRIRQRRGHNRGCGSEASKGGQFSHKKTLILAHFFNEKRHAVSAVTRDNTKIFSQLTVCLKAEAWPKKVTGGCNHYQFEKL